MNKSIMLTDYAGVGHFMILFLMVFGCNERAPKVLEKQHVSTNIKFVCPPCDQSCDKILFNEDGVCPHCNMNLIMSPDGSSLDSFIIQQGSGNFLISGGAGYANTLIPIFYHVPTVFSDASRILLVIPGAGRNGHDYRDAWIDASERYNLLIVSPSYSKEVYGFGDYHMGGMITDVSYVDDFVFKRNNNSQEWIYNDFDRIFLTIKKSLTFKTNHYDIFGHSAGGQILNRMILFYSSPYLNKVVASNAGWYTTTNDQLALPYGIKNTICDSLKLKEAFAQDLTLLIGEEDNASETRGTLQKSAQAMRQGAHRLERAENFYRSSQRVAANLDIPSKWKLEIVPNVGHDFKKMSQAAAALLYDE